MNNETKKEHIKKNREKIRSLKERGIKGYRVTRKADGGWLIQPIHERTSVTRRLSMKFKEYYNKKYFIRELDIALQADQENNMLDMITYSYDDVTNDEIITVIFADGNYKSILATGNSNGQNAKEIIGVIYGNHSI